MRKAIATKHGAMRTQERTEATKRGTERFVALAYDRGYHLAHTKGDLYLWIKKVCEGSPHINEPRIYNNHLYLFANAVLITVLNLPERFFGNVAPYIRKERKKMGYQSFTPTLTDAKPGEIWRYKTSSGELRECVILQVFEKYCSILPLHEFRQAENSYEVRSQKLMHADLGKVTFLYNNNLSDFILTQKEDDFTLLKFYIEQTISLVDKNAAPAEGEAENMAVDEADKTVALEGKPPISADLERLEQELSRARMEATVYKRLYDELLEKYTVAVQ